MDDFMEYFDSVSKNNKSISRALKYVILGKIYTTKMKDTGGIETSLRINFFGSDISSTGKDQSIKAFNTLVDRINKKNFYNKTLTFDKSVDVNDAALVGTKKKVKGQYEPVLGKFSKYDIMCFPECSSLFVKSEFKTTMVQILQGALDSPGYVSKSLAEVEIKYDTDTAVVMFSIPFKAMSSYLLDTGFFQRFLIYIGDKDYTDIREVVNVLAEDIIKDKSYREKLDNLDAFVNRVEETYNQKPAGYAKFDEKCLDKIKEFDDLFKEYIERLSTNQGKTNLATFHPRASKTFLRMGIINSIFNYHKTVQPEDFDEPLEMIRLHLDSVMKLLYKIRVNEIQKLPKPKQGKRKPYNINRVKDLIKSHVGGNTILYKKIAKSENVGMNTSVKIFNEVIVEAIPMLEVAIMDLSPEDRLKKAQEVLKKENGLKGD